MTHNKMWHRKQDWKHAVKKHKIDCYHWANYPLYNNLHQYSKNKIHCSCPLCAFHGETMPDKKANDRQEDQLREYETDNEEYGE